MCRLLYIRSEKDFEINPYLEKFAIMCKNSKENQGHGWGLSFIDEYNNFQHYKNINPVWIDDFHFTKNKKTKILIAHARSAFEDKDIKIENNMPFYDDKYVFIFNGELRGVKIKEQGKIGAEKIFNFIKRFDKGNLKEALEKAVSIIKKRTDYIKALNIIIADKKNVFVNNFFTLDEDYFCLRIKNEYNIENNEANESLIYNKRIDNKLIICSQELDNSNEWKKLEQGVFVF